MNKRKNSFFVLFFILALTACQGRTMTPVPPVLTVEPTTTPLTPVEAVPQATDLPTQNIPPVEQPTPEPNNSGQREDVTKIPVGENFTWQIITSGFSRPLGMTDAGNNDLYIVEQGGLIKVFRNGQVLTTHFLDLSDRVGAQANEQGLLGLALDADYLTNRIFYLNYTNKKGDTIISRFTANADFETADADSEQVLMVIAQPYANHNGGNIVFGPDGYLYIGMGDGGSGGDPQGNAQNPERLLGKMLRIAVRNQELYAIPADNPFANGGGRSEIFAVGLRNPWRFSFDSKTGDLWIADVGQGDWEEINLAVGNLPGINYGWDYREGKHAFEGSPPADLELIDPILEYDHSVGCSVTGGYVYRGQEFPEFYGVYLYGDYCSGVVWGAIRGEDDTWISEPLFSTGVNISSFGQDLDGEVYLIAHTGDIYQLTRN